MDNIEQCIRIYEVDLPERNALLQALKYLETRTWGFVPYSEVYESYYMIEAECCMDERGDMRGIEEVLDEYLTHYEIEYL